MFKMIERNTISMKLLQHKMTYIHSIWFLIEYPAFICKVCKFNSRLILYALVDSNNSIALDGVVKR